MYKHFLMTRGMLLHFVKGMDAETASVQPAGFNNNIHWHIGHLLVTAETFLFAYPQKSANIPVEYAQLFAMGTKPSDWQGEVPSIQELAALLQEQANRIVAIEPTFYEQTLPFKFPVPGIETFGDLYNLTLHHEAEHLGQMKAIKRAVQA